MNELEVYVSIEVHDREIKGTLVTGLDEILRTVTKYDSEAFNKTIQGRTYFCDTVYYDGSEEEYQVVLDHLSRL